MKSLVTAAVAACALCSSARCDDAKSKQIVDKPVVPHVLFENLLGDGTWVIDRSPSIEDTPTAGAIVVRRVQVGEYWLGVHCSSAGPVLRAHLKLPQDGGLVVDEVVPDSPAAKAGIARYDILLKFADAELNDASDLVAAIQSGKGNKAQIVLLHRGKKRTIEAAPAKRPRTVTVTGRPGEGRLAFDKWVRGLAFSPDGKVLKVHVVGPGALFGGKGDDKKEEQRIEVRIEKSGEGPAKIHVNRNGKQYNVTEKELGKLPKDIRERIEAHLKHHKGGGVDVDVHVHGKPGEKRRIERRVIVAPKGGGGAEAIRIRAHADGVGKKLDEINAKLDRLQKTIQALQKQLGSRKGSK